MLSPPPLVLKYIPLLFKIVPLSFPSVTQPMLATCPPPRSLAPPSSSFPLLPPSPFTFPPTHPQPPGTVAFYVSPSGPASFSPGVSTSPPPAAVTFSMCFLLPTRMASKVLWSRTDSTPFTNGPTVQDLTSHLQRSTDRVGQLYSPPSVTQEVN